MKYLKTRWLIFLLAIILLIAIIILLNYSPKKSQPDSLEKGRVLNREKKSFDSIKDSVILYGKQLIDSTSKYLGPHGVVASITNGLNCSSCHLESGTKLHTFNFMAVASTYPKFRERSGRIESVEFRINECLQRSLNGKKIDSLSKEMRALVAYIKWTGIDINPAIAKTKELPFLERAADPERGKLIYLAKCKSCHGENGGGVLIQDSLRYVYPPLWGEHSYAVSAGMFRITKLASFIKYNMPFGATFEKPQVTDAEAWDLAGYITSQPRPKKMFAYDWPVVSTKPVDYPFGPYTDTFSERQHKYGPFAQIEKAKKR